MNFPRLIPRLSLVAGIAGAVVWAGLNREQFDPTAMDAWLSGLGIWVPVVYVTLYAVGTVAFLPGSMFALAGGALFGPVGARFSISLERPLARVSPLLLPGISQAIGSSGRLRDG